MKIVSWLKMKNRPQLKGVVVGVLTFIVVVVLVNLFSSFVSVTQLSYEKSLGSESIKMQLAKGSVVAIGFQLLQFLLLEVNFFVALIVGCVAGYVAGKKGGKVGFKTAVVLFALAVFVWILSQTLVGRSVNSRTDVIRFIVTFPRFAVLAYLGGLLGEMWFQKKKQKEK